MQYLQNVLDLLVKSNAILNTNALAYLLSEATDPLHVAMVLFGEADLPSIDDSLLDEPDVTERNRTFANYDLLKDAVIYTYIDHRYRTQHWKDTVPSDCSHIPLNDWPAFVSANEDEKGQRRIVIGPASGTNTYRSSMPLSTWQEKTSVEVF